MSLYTRQQDTKLNTNKQRIVLSMLVYYHNYTIIVKCICISILFATMMIYTTLVSVATLCGTILVFLCCHCFANVGFYLGYILVTLVGPNSSATLVSSTREIGNVGFGG